MTGDDISAILTLKDLLELNLTETQTGGIRLAILSACETGLAGIENADEAIGLPTGLLQAGVAGVVASLWSVFDLSTILFLAKFYELWLKQNLSAWGTLHQAQIWFRKSTEAEIAPLLGLRTRFLKGYGLLWLSPILQRCIRDYCDRKTKLTQQSQSLRKIETEQKEKLQVLKIAIDTQGQTHSTGRIVIYICNSINNSETSPARNPDSITARTYTNSLILGYRWYKELSGSSNRHGRRLQTRD